MLFHQHLAAYFLGFPFILVLNSLPPPDFTLKVIFPNAPNKTFWTNTDKVLVRSKHRFVAHTPRKIFFSLFIAELLFNINIDSKLLTGSHNMRSKVKWRLVIH